MSTNAILNFFGREIGGVTQTTAEKRLKKNSRCLIKDAKVK
jgi:hypothetical protein